MKFFTRFNRDKQFMMLHLWYVLETWLQDPGCQLTKSEKDDLTKAKDMIWNVAERIFKRLDKDYGKKVVRDLEQSMVVIERASKPQENINVVKRESTDIISEYAILFCNSQLREGCIKYKKCRLYNALQDAGVPTCVLETNACPYRGESYSKKTKKWTPVVEFPEIRPPYRQSICQQCGQLWTATSPEDERDVCPDCGGKLGEWR